MKKTLLSLLVGTLTLSAFEKPDLKFPEYNFSGKIGEEHIIFTERHFRDINRVYLTITKKDSEIAKITYIDDNADLKVDYVCIRRKNKDSFEEYDLRYFMENDDEVLNEVMRNSQREFDKYLDKIIEKKNPIL